MNEQSDLTILSLDLAQKTGWAVIENNEVTVSGTVDFTKKRGEDNGILFLKLRKWLIDTINEYSPDVVGYERAHYRGGDSTELCVGMQTHAMSSAREKGCSIYSVHTGTLKKWAAGHGRASKEAMIKSASDLTGKEITDDDEADAVCVGMLANEELNPK